MPNTESAKKRLRQNAKRRLHNRAIRSSLRTLLRKVRESVQAGDVEQAETAARVMQKRFDQAAAKGIIHPNAAARTKSRVSAAIRRLKQPAAA